MCQIVINVNYLLLKEDAILLEERKHLPRIVCQNGLFCFFIDFIFQKIAISFLKSGFNQNYHNPIYFNSQ